MDINNTIAQRLKQIIDDSSQNLITVCREAKVHQPSISKFLLRQQDRIKLEDLINISNYLKIPIQTFWSNESFVQINDEKTTSDLPADYAFIPFFDVKVSAGHGEIIENEKSRLMPVERSFITRLGYRAADLSVVEVAGDSMEPTLRSGDLVIVYVPSIAVDFIAGVYVLRDQWGLKVKRLDRDKYGNLTVISDNGHYEKIIYTPDEEGTMVSIIGRVVGRLAIM